MAIRKNAGHEPDALSWLSLEVTRAALPQARGIDVRIAKTAGETLAAPRYDDLEGGLQAVRAGLGRALLAVAVGDRGQTRDRREPGAPPRRAVQGRPPIPSPVLLYTAPALPLFANGFFRMTMMATPAMVVRPPIATIGRSGSPSTMMALTMVVRGSNNVNGITALIE